MKSFRLILALTDVWGSLQNIGVSKRRIIMFVCFYYISDSDSKMYISQINIFHQYKTNFTRYSKISNDTFSKHPSTSSSWCSSRSNLLSTLESISLRVLHLVEKCMGSPAQYYNMKTFQYFHLIPTYETIYDALRKNKLRVYGL